jgi:hypothetical protein
VHLHGKVRRFDLLARIPAKTGGSAADGDLRDAGGVCAAIFRTKFLSLRCFNPGISVQSSRRGSRPVASLFPLKIMISQVLELIEIADTVTDMQEVKHAFKSGIVAQAGVEW